MSGLILGLAVLAALGIVGAAAYRKKRAHRKLAAQPGYTFEVPLEVRGFDEVDTFVKRALCPQCQKASLWRQGEDTKSFQGKVLHVVRTECAQCESLTPLVFDISDVAN